MTIGESIRIVRSRRGFRQKEVAKRVGVTQSLLSRIENGRRDPNVSLVGRIAEAMEVPPQLIFLMACELKPEYRDYRPALQRLSLSMLELLDSVLKATKD
jgi:transcriptional regulator with XRE-family HTH domain